MNAPPTAARPPAVQQLVLAIVLALGTGAANAAEPPTEAETAELLRRMSEQLGRQQAEIDTLRGQVEALLMQQRGRGLSGVPASQAADQDPAAQETARAAGQLATDERAQQDGDTATANQPATQPAVAAQDPAAAQPLQVGEARREEDAERREQEKALVVREHAPLFERKFTFETGLSYSYYDRRQLALSGFLALDAIFLGTLNLDQTKASVMTLDVSGRYGLTDRFSIEGSIPWVQRDTRFVSGGAGGASTEISEVQLSSSGIGDVSVAAYYQWVKESSRWPDIVTSLRVRAPTGRHPFGLKLIMADEDNNNLNIPEDLPTGTGLWSATANISALRTYDPVILFGNLGYTVYRPEKFDDISPVLDQVSPAEVSLGNTIQLSAGMAIALNDRSAISFSVASAFSAATHTTAPGKEEMRVPGSSSNSSTFNVGGTYALPSGWTLSSQATIGLTPDAPNFVLGLRASHTF
ncbi:transporter [Novilysobacter arseniciresistens]|uniref:transporter n=1 Tax=Novilysobacter arseniciresistens TaxID=1385522 RepID=UPI001363243A|nr:transporter [Lysobacter arseniciresistens]